jgi:hypothetical protein
LEGFENEMLRKLYGNTKDEGSGGWEVSSNKKVYDFCSSSSVVK